MAEQNREWYVAEIVLQIEVQGDPRTVVHVNTTLVEASGPDDAYDKALELGREQETHYKNPAGKQVTFRFKGLRELNQIYDELKHGSEIFYEETVDPDPDWPSRVVTPREKLALFHDAGSREGPDYASGTITAIVEGKHNGRS